MLKRLERHQIKAIQVFDLEDAFARARRVKGAHPRPFGSIHFYIVAQMTAGGGREVFAQPLELQTIINPSGYHLFFGKFLLPDGSRRDNFMAGGQYVIRVESQYYQPVEREVTLPMPDPKTPEFFDLEPGYAYPFPRINGRLPTLLYGKVQNAVEEGVAFVTITLAGETASYWTEQTGQWVLIFPDDWQTDTVTLTITLPDNSSQTFNDIEVKRGQANSIPPVTLSV